MQSLLSISAINCSPSSISISMTCSHAIWNHDCDSILIDALFKKWQDGRQSDNASWHSSAWTTAETLLAGTETHTGGSPKTTQSCQTHWGMVSLD
jgi:hypothetical protein